MRPRTEEEHKAFAEGFGHGTRTSIEAALHYMDRCYEETEFLFSQGRVEVNHVRIMDEMKRCRRRVKGIAGDD